MLHAFIYGAILCLGLIFPLGVQNVFIFNQGATQKRWVHALPSVLTAFSCDVILIVSAILGVSVIVLTLPWLKTIIFLVGLVFLLYMGWVTWHSKAKLQEGGGGRPFSTKKQIGFAMSFSLLNPHALLDTIGVIGTNSLHFVGAEKAVYAFACSLVSFIWFMGLSITGHFVHRLDKSGTAVRLINKVSALIIWGVAGYIAWQLVK